MPPHSQDAKHMEDPSKQQQQDVPYQYDQYGGFHELPHEERPPRELPAEQSPVELDASRNKFGR